MLVPNSQMDRGMETNLVGHSQVEGGTQTMLVGCLVDAETQTDILMELAKSVVDVEVQTEGLNVPVHSQVDIEVQTNCREEMVVKQMEAVTQTLSVLYVDVELQAGMDGIDFGMQTVSPPHSPPPSDTAIPPWGDVMSL
jgi:hypothetical protein